MQYFQRISLSLILAAFCMVALTGLPVEQASAASAGAKKTSSTSKGGGKAQSSKKKQSSSASKTSPQITRISGNKKGKKGSTAKTYTARRPVGKYKGAVVYDFTKKKLLFSENANVKVPPASLTKIISMYVAEDAIRARKISRGTTVTVSARAAAAGGSRMGLQRGDKVSLDDLLRGMAVSSGNDASIAVAEFIGGTEDKFVQMMNQKARVLGMKGSTFKNPNGLPAPGQYTTANDMLLLARSYLAAYPGNLKKYHNQTCNTYNGCFTNNANPLLGSLPGADGLKTGFVSAAGFNLIATAERNGQRIIGVILGSPSSGVRAREATALMESGFGGRLVASAPDPVDPEKVAMGKKATENARARDMASSSDTDTSSPAKRTTQSASSSSKSGGKKQSTQSKSSASRKTAATASASALP